MSMALWTYFAVVAVGSDTMNPRPAGADDFHVAGASELASRPAHATVRPGTCEGGGGGGGGGGELFDWAAALVVLAHEVYFPELTPADWNSERPVRAHTRYALLVSRALLCDGYYYTVRYLVLVVGIYVHELCPLARALHAARIPALAAILSIFLVSGAGTGFTLRRRLSPLSSSDILIAWGGRRC
ncbi:hypothetical protein C8F04DRAFT_1271303 [Mycena alexandri]|uniref:Uncharacterized protein n=1 Tax=Mycena alexandri TaxID=1745969 RepID=A0AAD6SDJ8_9AGAR|nr:hypothetical protein C8F04DRAFT_1271303 [Mycena alexandri]